MERGDQQLRIIDAERIRSRSLVPSQPYQPQRERRIHFGRITPVDGRKQAASLALLVEQSLGRNVFEPALYVFTTRRRDRVRILFWERKGLCLWGQALGATAVHLAAFGAWRDSGDLLRPGRTSRWSF